jgi:uncharacterized protein (TIGR03067 family)
MKPDTARTDAERLQGTWSVVSLEMDGQSLPEAMLADGRIEVEGDRFRSLNMGAVYEGTMSLDPAARPRTFDLVFTQGPEKGNTNRGIYEIKGDQWKLCLATRGDARPTAFATRPATGHALQVLRRADSATSAQPKMRDAAAAPEAPTELEGEWRLVSGFLNGKPMDDMMVRYGVRSFRGNRTTLKFGPQTYIDAIFTLDASQTPGAIDYSHTKGMYAGKSQLGIYEYDGKTLKLASSPPGQPRPTDFEERGANTISIFKRS